jgi:signal transduction histidine kinase
VGVVDDVFMAIRLGGPPSRAHGAGLSTSVGTLRPVTAGRGSGDDGAVTAALGVLAVLAGVAGGVLHVLNASAGRGFEPSFWLVLALAAVAFGAVGATLGSRSRVRRVPALMVTTGLGQGLTLLLMEYAVLGPLPLAPAALWVATWLWAPSLFLSAAVLPLLLPDGALLSARWRPAARFGWFVIVLHTVVWAVTPYEAQFPPIVIRDLHNPFGTAAAAHPAVQVVLAALTVAAAGIAVASLVVRWRQSSGDARQQLKWLAVGAASAVLLFGLGAPTPQPFGELMVGLAALPVPLAAGVAALRHRLWDVDVAISTGVRYVLLSLVVVGVYTAVVGMLGAATGAPVIATAAVALILLPLHSWLQRWVNRLVHGEAEDPGTALSRLGEQLEATGEPSEVADRLLPTVVARLAALLRSPYAMVELADGGVVVHGEPAAECERIPLSFGGARVGVLVLSARQRSRAERARLEHVSRQAAVAVHSVLLTREARRARQLVVVAREEERRRLRWDLHDGVAPLIAGLALQAETARDLVETDPATTRGILDRLVPQLAGAVADVRAIVHELRPAALDELGLAGAVGELAARFDRPGTRVQVATAGIAELPAAVDLAAYRIVAEALNNAVRHGGAATVAITLRGEADQVRVTVTDDGRGLPADTAAGVGLTSMRVRAEELGGRLEVSAPPSGGTTVAATLPLATGEDEA